MKHLGGEGYGELGETRCCGLGKNCVKDSARWWKTVSASDVVLTQRLATIPECFAYIK